MVLLVGYYRVEDENGNEAVNPVVSATVETECGVVFESALTHVRSPNGNCFHYV